MMKTKNRLVFVLGAGLLAGGGVASVYAQAPAAAKPAAPAAPAVAPAAVEAPAPAPTGGFEGAATSSGSVSATVDQIETMIQLPPTARLKRESDEDPSKPTSIFASPEVREKLLGKTPAFVYIPVGIDPMVIPWVREAIVIQEKMEDAKRLLDEAKKADNPDPKAPAESALKILKELQAKYPTNEKMNEVATMAQEAEEAIKNGPVVGPNSGTGKAALPVWIRQNTTGIVLDRKNPNDSLIVVGDFLLHRGDRVERFPNVVVKDILPEAVVYEYMGAEFTVSVSPY